MTALVLVPSVATRLPGTRVEIRWDGDRPVTIHRNARGFWDLSPIVVPDRVLAYERLADRPGLGWWPLTAITRRATYRTTWGC